MSRTSRRPQALSLTDLSQALTSLENAAQLLRRRLDTIDPLSHPARWAAVNDQVRLVDQRLAKLREDQQQCILAQSELGSLPSEELAALQLAASTLARLVRDAATVAAVAEAAVRLADTTGSAIQRVRTRS